MKKLMAILGLVTIVGSSASMLVACGGGGLDTSPITGEKIHLVTDAGKVDDKSFNESGFKGGNQFQREILGKNEDIDKTQPQSLTELESAYTNAKFDGARTLILPGFHHAVEGANAAPQIMNGGSTIILDNVAGGFDNQIGIMYRGDISGFLAAFGGMVELSNNADFTGKTIKMATFGGSHNAGAVDNFMVGFLAAIEVYNEVTKPENKELATAMGIGDLGVKFSRADSQKNAPTNNQDGKWFTNSFNIGGANEIVTNMLGEGVNVIMPVAGPQTSDVLSKMKEKDLEAKSLFVIGVDTDQSTQYTEKDGNVKGRFLSSAQKALKESTVIALGHSKGYVENTEVQEKITDYAEENKATFTYEDEEGVFQEYDLEAKKAEAWEGQTLWMGGKAATGGTNQLKAETAAKIEEIITSTMLEDSSKALFETIAVTPDANVILSNETIKAYADLIIGSIIKK